MRVVLICSAGNRLNRDVLPAFLASKFDLAGIVAIEDRGSDRLSRVRHELRRSKLGIVDVIAYRLYYRLVIARRDHADDYTDALLESFPPVGEVPVLTTSDVNHPETTSFLESLEPDVGFAACKTMLGREVYDVPRHGTFVVHPGIVPEYRNSYGCFWALARRDLDRVGASLLRIDEGVDTGPVYAYYTTSYDERSESHLAIQRRVVYDNLDRIAADLRQAVDGTLQPIDTTGRDSAAWGQPHLTAYLRWKHAARRDDGTDMSSFAGQTSVSQRKHHS